MPNAQRSLIEAGGKLTQQLPQQLLDVADGMAAAQPFNWQRMVSSGAFAVRSLSLRSCVSVRLPYC